MLAGLVWTEKRTPQPMVHLRLLADRLFASTTAVMFTGVMACSLRGGLTPETAV
jgi:hypothetical protein